MSINTKNDLNGWILIDKPLNIGSTQVVSKLKWALSPQKIGHAGTLDPLATGLLPIALGRATKLIPFVMDGTKVYDFTITWGTQTDTDDAAGKPIKTSENRPTEAEILSVISQFVGDVVQLPPAYSALKIAGQRAYDLARAGQEVHLTARTVHIDSLELIGTTPDTADFRVTCGKGTYVRSLGRDIGEKLGCLGYITNLRRLACGPFQVKEALPLSDFQEKNTPVHLIPIEEALGEMRQIQLPPTETKRLIQGQRLPVRQITAFLHNIPHESEVLCLMENNRLKGLIQCRQGILHPYRIFSD